MKTKYIYLLLLMSVTLFFASTVLSADKAKQPSAESQMEVVWKQGVNVAAFWSSYAESKGGLTWPRSTVYPEYAKVQEGDTFLVELESGVCLMEFFHSRWRRANDVRRWDDSVNQYGACPYVFE